MKFLRLAIQGFRAFSEKQELHLGRDSLLCFIYGENSQGKTSLAEAIEFLLSGKTSRRDVTAITKSEFQNGLRNAHFTGETWVEADIEHLADATTPATMTVRRRLVSDYPDGNADCVSELECRDDDGNWTPWSFADIGYATWDDPVQLPMIFQHTLRYVCSVRPRERRDYFRALLDVSDIARLREQVRQATENLSLMPPDPQQPAVLDVARALANQEGFGSLSGLLAERKPAESEVSQTLVDLARTLLADAGNPVADETSGAQVFEAFSAALRASRLDATGVPDLSLPQLPENWLSPDLWDAPVGELIAFVTEAKKQYDRVNEILDQQTQRLIPFLQAGLKLPQFADAYEGRKECPFCLTPDAVPWERVEEIRELLGKPTEIQRVREEVKRTLQDLSDRAEVLERIITTQVPREMLDFAPSLLTPYIASCQDLFAEWKDVFSTLTQASEWLIWLLRRAREEVAWLCEIAERGEPFSVTPLPDWRDKVRSATQDFVRARERYIAIANSLWPIVSGEIDAQSGRQHWQSLIRLSAHNAVLCRAIVEQQARHRVRESLQQAADQIAAANSQVLLHDKFPALNEDITRWWRLLRPSDAVVFKEVAQRGRGLREFDIKATVMQTPENEDTAVERDALAVFSDSHLNCLGLSVFLARTQREEPGFLVFDDPIQSLDREHADFITMSVIGKLVDELGLQVILLSHDADFWRDLLTHHAWRFPKGFRVKRPVRDGAVVEDCDSQLFDLLRVVDQTHRIPDAEVFELSGNRLRIATEVFCKEVIARYGSYEDQAVLPSQFDGTMLPELIRRAEPYLTLDPAHPGKIRHIEGRTNTSSHDCVMKSPGDAALRVMYGDLKKLGKDYRVL